MRIAVCIKQVPLGPVSFDRERKVLRREEGGGAINPNDRVALKRALELAKPGDGVTALSMGPPGAEDSLREALALGVDRAVLLSDRRMAEADTLATAYTLSRGIARLGGADLILCGSRTLDSETGHVGPQLAEFLGLPFLSYVGDLQVEGTTIRAERIVDNYIEEIEAALPAVISISHKISENIYPSLGGLNRAFEGGEVLCWNIEEIGADPMRTGLPGSGTVVRRILGPEKQRQALIINDDGTEETVKALLEGLKDRNVRLRDRVMSGRKGEGFDL